MFSHASAASHSPVACARRREPPTVSVDARDSNSLAFSHPRPHAARRLGCAHRATTSRDTRRASSSSRPGSITVAYARACAARARTARCLRRWAATRVCTQSSYTLRRVNTSPHRARTCAPFIPCMSPSFWPSIKAINVDDRHRRRHAPSAMSRTCTHDGWVTRVRVWDTTTYVNSFRAICVRHVRHAHERSMRRDTHHILT